MRYLLAKLYLWRARLSPDDPRAVDWLLLVGALALFPLIFVSHRTWIARIRPIYRGARETRENVDAHATEAFGGMRVVRAFGKEHTESLRFTAGAHFMARQEILAWWWSRALELIWRLGLPATSVAVLLYGVSIQSALLLIVYASFWQVLIQVLYGVADVDNVAMNTARSYGLGPLARLRYVIFPTTLPYLMTGIRLAAAVALILAITAQLIIGTPGLGAEIAKAQSGGSYVAMYALILATGMLGVLINIVMRVIERRVLSWHSSVRTEVVK